LDLAPIQPRYVPLNCWFYIGDMMEDLDERTFPDGSLDLVHLRFVRLPRSGTDDDRHIHSAVKLIKWPALLRNIYRMLKPGNGWIQLGELGTSATTANPPESSVLWQVYPLFKDCIEASFRRNIVEYKSRTEHPCSPPKNKKPSSKKPDS
jgi:hypothetical protein